MVNFSRRQLLYSAAERLMGAGTETDDEISVPKTIGVPMTPGMKLGMYVAWHNDTGKDLDGVYLKLTMLWTPKNQNPRPVNSLPIYMDVNLTVGGSNTFDVPPGKSSKAYEFTLPVGGRLLGVGGHMHDYGVGVRLEDAETGKVDHPRRRHPRRQGQADQGEPEALRRERRRAQAQGAITSTGSSASTTIRPTRPGSRARWRTWSACSCPTT